MIRHIIVSLFCALGASSCAQAAPDENLSPASKAERDRLARVIPSAFASYAFSDKFPQVILRRSPVGDDGLPRSNDSNVIDPSGKVTRTERSPSLRILYIPVTGCKALQSFHNRDDVQSAREGWIFHLTEVGRSGYSYGYNRTRQFTSGYYALWSIGPRDLQYTINDRDESSYTAPYRANTVTVFMHCKRPMPLWSTSQIVQPSPHFYLDQAEWTMRHAAVV